MKSNDTSLVFPSGRSVAAVKKDAKKLARSKSLSLSNALDQLVVANGLRPMAWSNALQLLDSHTQKPNRENPMNDKTNPFPDTQYKAHTFSKADMSGTKFNGVDLTQSHFWAVLKNVQFKDCNMMSAIFNDVNLSDSSYENINFSNSTLNNLNMSNVTFSNLNMENVEITDASLIGMKINGVLVSELFAAYEKANG